MKRSDFFIRLTTGLLFLAVTSYIGIYVYNALTNTYTTTTAISYAVEETLPAQGYIVRTETVVDDVGSAVLPIVGEGVKVAAGQPIAVEYTNTEALEIASEIRSLTMRIAQLETSGNAGDTASYDAVRELSVAVHSRDLRRLDEISLNIEANVFEVKEDLAELKRRLADLEKRNIGARTITAHVSGTFSHIVDGFEHITPELVYEVTPTQLHDSFKAPHSIHGAGKLITEFTWYYVAVMSHEDAAQLSVGQVKAIQFFGAYQTEVRMLVENVGIPEGGSCVVLFSSDRGIHDVAPLRALHADVVFEVITGIRVPI